MRSYLEFRDYGRDGVTAFQKVQIVSVMKRQKKPILVTGEQMIRNVKQNPIPNPKGHWVPNVWSQG